MPNNVRNIIKMKGIVNLPLFYTNEGKKCFDFNKLIPMPDSLNVPCGSITDEAIIYYVTDKCSIPIGCVDKEKLQIVKDTIFMGAYERTFLRTMESMWNKPERERNDLYEKGRVYVENYKKYGCATWYDWSIINWGTKWNAYSNEQVGDDMIIFSTAWDEPSPIVQKLSEKYPNIEIEHLYADEFEGNKEGYKIYFGGKAVEKSTENMDIYHKCWGR